MTGSGLAMAESTTPERRYDKGEKRFKHAGHSDHPQIEYSSRNPRMWVGKCPRRMSAAIRARLLAEAIPEPQGDRNTNYPKKLYVVHEGAIYEARTSDHGRTYHGFPYRGKLYKGTIESLTTMAEEKGCLPEFKRWIREHIDIGGGA